MLAHTECFGDLLCEEQSRHQRLLGSRVAGIELHGAARCMKAQIYRRRPVVSWIELETVLVEIDDGEHRPGSREGWKAVDHTFETFSHLGMPNRTQLSTVGIEGKGATITPHVIWGGLATMACAMIPYG